MSKDLKIISLERVDQNRCNISDPPFQHNFLIKKPSIKAHSSSMNYTAKAEKDHDPELYNIVSKTNKDHAVLDPNAMHSWVFRIKTKFNLPMKLSKMHILEQTFQAIYLIGGQFRHNG